VVPPLPTEEAWIDTRHLVPALQHIWLPNELRHPLLEACGLDAVDLLLQPEDRDESFECLLGCREVVLVDFGDDADRSQRLEHLLDARPTAQFNRHVVDVNTIALVTVAPPPDGVQERERPALTGLLGNVSNPASARARLRRE
jgi:hypothetical protein